MTVTMAKLDIDIDYVAQLAELLQRTGLTEIEIGQGEARVRVAKQIHMTIDASMLAGAAPHPATATPVATQADAHGTGIDPSHPGLVVSPMVGTAYLLPDPASPPFVAEGQEVVEGATLLIIEAMKVMNAIRAHKSGTVRRVLIKNASPVEYGEHLMLIE